MIKTCKVSINKDINNTHRMGRTNIKIQTENIVNTMKRKIIQIVDMLYTSEWIRSMALLTNIKPELSYKIVWNSFLFPLFQRTQMKKKNYFFSQVENQNINQIVFHRENRFHDIRNRIVLFFDIYVECISIFDVSWTSNICCHLQSNQKVSYN